MINSTSLGTKALVLAYEQCSSSQAELQQVLIMKTEVNAL